MPSSKLTVQIIALLSFLIGPCVGASFSRSNSTNGLAREEWKTPFDQGGKSNGLAIVTYVADHSQERHAAALIKSLRAFGGAYSGSTVYVVLADPDNLPCNSLKSSGVILVSAEVDAAAREYPLAIKAFAAAQVERMIGNSVETLAWFDPETIILGPLDDLDLEGKDAIALRPVFLVNTIGLPPGAAPNAYWAPIYSALKLDPQQVPVVETVVDRKQVKAYYNCEIFSVRPELGIFQEWARQLAPLLSNVEYQRNACVTFLQRLFLHQAVLSAVIVSKVAPGDMRTLPMKCGYPLNQHARLPVEKRADKLNALSCAIIDELWRQNPRWMEVMPVDEPLRSWLASAYQDFLKIGGSIYRIEGSCNSYLITTKTGSVLIDPAGASGAPEWFARVIRESPLRAILLTHGHSDHRDSISLWRKNPRIPVIAQRNHVDLLRYEDRLAGFFARRNAVWARKPFPTEAVSSPHTPIGPSVLFADNYTYTLDGVHFKMIHTPGETPDHVTIWIPELEAVCVGDNYFEYFINNATLRGTTTRPMLGYIRALDTALSYNPQFFLMGHGSPIIGRQNVRKTVTNFRNALQYLHEATVKGLNEGKDVYTLMQQITLPRQYGIAELYGKAPWTVRGIWQEYVGWFDENPASMYSMPVAGIYPDIVQLAGGSSNLVGRAEEVLNSGEFVKVLHLTDIVLSQEPANERALATRLKALKELRARSRNYIENIWLDYGIRTAEEKLQTR